jgi:hypothetical protein
MMKLDYSRWTCDRCGIKLDDTLNLKPKNWVGLVIIVDKPLPISDNHPNYHLCADCHRDLLRFLNKD